MSGYLRILRLAVMCVICASAGAQTALVTFYNEHRTKTQLSFEDGLRKDSSLAAFGRVFDGKQDLFAFDANTAVTIALPAGDHIFSPTILSQMHPGTENLLSMELKEGEHYYLRFTAKVTKSAIVWVWVDPRLEAVDCAQAAMEIAKSTPLDVRRMSKYTLRHRGPSTPPVVCAASP